MIVMPDTNAWIKLLNPGNTPVKDRFVVTDPGDIRLCSVVNYERLGLALSTSTRYEPEPVPESQPEHADVLVYGYLGILQGPRVGDESEELVARLPVSVEIVGTGDGVRTEGLEKIEGPWHVDRGGH